VRDSSPADCRSAAEKNAPESCIQAEASGLRLQLTVKNLPGRFTLSVNLQQKCGLCAAEPTGRFLSGGDAESEWEEILLWLT